VKRIASAFLLFLFLFNVIGYYALFFVLNSENKAEMDNTLRSEEQLQTIRVHRSEVKNLIFKEEGKEVQYEGEMYDIKSITRDGDFIVFHCINDKTEKQLLTGLQIHVKNNTDSNSTSDKKENTSKNPVKDLFCNTENSTEITSKTVEFPSSIYHLTSYISPTLPLPPPEVFFS
jgi:cbb3-type cytochrome oxidase subunit 3